MEARTSLRGRVLWGLLGYAAVLTLAVFAHGVIVNERAEALVWKTLLDTELDHIIDPLSDLLAGYAHNCAVNDDILSGGQVWMKTDTQLQEGRHLAIYLYPSFRWPDDIGDYLEHGALSRAVVANYADELAVIHLEVDILQREECLVTIGSHQFRKILKDRRPFLMRDSEGLPEVLHSYAHSDHLSKPWLQSVEDKVAQQENGHSGYGQV